MYFLHQSNECQGNCTVSLINTTLQPFTDSCKVMLNVNIFKICIIFVGFKRESASAHEFIKRKFLETQPPSRHRSRMIYTHQTCATG